MKLGGSLSGAIQGDWGTRLGADQMTSAGSGCLPLFPPAQKVSSILPGSCQWPLCSHWIPLILQSPPHWRGSLHSKTGATRYPRQQRRPLSCQSAQSPWGLTCPGSERSHSYPDTHTPSQEQTAPLRSHAYGSAPSTGGTETREMPNTVTRVHTCFLDASSQGRISRGQRGKALLTTPSRGPWASSLLSHKSAKGGC